MQKVSRYLPTEEEIVTFFDSHSGSHTVIRITELLLNGKVNHTTPHDEEWKHVRAILHNLKGKGFLVAENEGKNAIEESFYSTPDRLKKYRNPELDKTDSWNVSKVINVNSGNGSVVIGDHNFSNNEVKSIRNAKAQATWNEIFVGVAVLVIFAILNYVIRVFTGVDTNSLGV